MNPYRELPPVPAGRRWGATWFAKLTVRVLFQRVECMHCGKMVRKDRAWFGGWSWNWYCVKHWGETHCVNQ